MSTPIHTNNDVEFTVPTLPERLQVIRTLPGIEIEQLAKAVLDSRLPWTYLDGLEQSDRIIALRAALLLWGQRQSTQVPREVQLRSTLATRHGRDVLLNAGTGTGKTLPTALNCMLDDPAQKKLVLSILPLKRLQLTQTDDFNNLYGIRTVAINEDTPRDDVYWNVRLIFTYSLDSIQPLYTEEYLQRKEEATRRSTTPYHDSRATLQDPRGPSPSPWNTYSHPAISNFPCTNQRRRGALCAFRGNSKLRDNSLPTSMGKAR